MIQIWKFLAKQKKGRGIVFAPFFHMLIFSLILLTGNLRANPVPNASFPLEKDSIMNLEGDSIAFNSTDSLSLDSVEAPKKSAVETTVTYSARDSMRVNTESKMAYLYGDAKVTYGKIQLTSDYMEIDLNKNEVKATYTTDSLGEPVGKPVFKDASDMFVADLIRYNFNSKKGIVSGVVTQQGEGYVHGDRVKFNEKMESFINDAKYTTCNLPDPHFHINAKKIKLIPEKKVISGPFYMKLNDVPTPFGFAFGFFPIPKERSSGLIIPEWGEAQDRGFFLRSGGYYWAVNNNLTVKFLGEIYTNGSWGVSMINDYKKRYGYSGNMSLQYFNRIDDRSEDTEPSRTYWIKWNHRPVPKGPYGARLTASVNLGSQDFNRDNTYNINSLQSATFNSNVTWAKSFRNTPINTTITTRQSQNTVTGVTEFTLPNMNISTNRIYPFKQSPKLKKSEFFKKFTLGPRLDFQNKLSNKARNSTSINNINVTNGEADTSNIAELDQSFERITANPNYGAKFTTPISTSMKVFRHWNLNPSISYTDYIYGQELDIRTDSSGMGVVIDTLQKFSRAGEYSFRAGLTTRIYGTYFFKGDSKVKAIRHTFIPTLSGNFRPDFSEVGSSYTEVVVDTNGTKEKFSKYNGFVYGGPSNSEQATLGFNLTNIVEMKKVDKKDTLGRTKKVKILDNLGISGNYNFAASQFNLSKINFTAVSKIGKFNFRLGMVVDPYTYILDSTINDQNFQRRVDEFAWNTGNSLGNIEQFSFNLGGRIDPKSFKPRDFKSDEGTPEEISEIENNINDYVDFTIPWSIQLQYNFIWTKIGFNEPDFTSNVQVRGDLKLTQKWKVSYQTAFDLKEQQFSTTTLGIHRDLHCWQMGLNLVLNGVRQSYSFNISAKASILQDLKLNKQAGGLYN